MNFDLKPFLTFCAAILILIGASVAVVSCKQSKQPDLIEMLEKSFLEQERERTKP